MAVKFISMQKYQKVKGIMKHTNYLWGLVLLSICIFSPVILVADDDPNAY